MIRKLRAIFKNIDKDGSGTITKGGAYAGLSQVFPSYSLPDFENTLEKETIRAAGKDRVVDLDEFECVAKKLYNIKKVYDEFKQYDKNHDMKMDRKELESALIKFYFKDVAKRGLVQTAIVKATVKKRVDAIIKSHDKNHDSSVSWKEFEMDAFIEEHYHLGGKCSTSKTPLNKHEISVVENLVKKFRKSGSKNQLSHSSWYQITSMLTEQTIDKTHGEALGCYYKIKVGQDNTNARTTTAGHYFGPNGGNTFGRGRSQFGDNRLAGGRVLLRRFLQPQKTAQKQAMSLKQALAALHKQADSNHDGHISDHEILDIFQGVRDHLSTSDFGSFLDMVNKIKGPVDCGKFKDCSPCTVAQNAGLCGWFATNWMSPFGGYLRYNGVCKFVDRSNNAEQSNGKYFASTTCSDQCRSSHFRQPYRGG